MNIEGKLLARIEVKATGTKENKVHFESNMLSVDDVLVVGLLVHCIEVCAQQMHADPIRLACAAARAAQENVATGGREYVQMQWDYGEGIDA